MTITDDTGKEFRRCELPKDPGLRRVEWNLRGNPAAPTGNAGGRGGRGGGAGGRGAGAGADAAAPAPAPAPGVTACAAPTGGGRGGFGGNAPLAAPGRYTISLGTMTADQVTPIGKPQTFRVLPLPAKNY